MFRTLLATTLAVLGTGLAADAQEITGATPLSPNARRLVPKGDTTLDCGEVAAGHITEPGRSQRFTFQGTLGDVVDVVLVAIRGFEGTLPRATVTSPTEGDLFVLSGTTLRNLVLPETGEYAITVTGDQPGTFKVGRGCWPPTVAAGFLNCDDVLGDSLDEPGELDYFAFAGQLNDEVNLSLVETGGFAGSSPRATLFSPTDVPLGTFDADSVVPFTLPETGNYLVRVRANTLTGTGTYNIGLTCFPPPNPVPLVCGTTPFSSVIMNPGEVRFFTFDGGVDDVIEVTLAGTGEARPQMRIVDPLGSQLGVFSSNSLTGLRLAQTGQFTIEVKASTLAQTGAFTIGLACRNPLGPATALPCGGMASGSLAVVGQLDFYTFTGVAGDVGELTLTETAGFPGTSTPRMRVFSPTGIDLGAFQAGSVNPITLPETGTYTVRVTSNTLVDTGTYTLALACLPPSGTTHLGDDVLLPGDISAPGEMDCFSFFGETNEVVELPLVVTSGFGGTFAQGTLTAPSTALVGTVNSNGLGEFTLPETGTYTFKIVSADLISTGAYRTGMERRTNPGGGQNEDPESPALACGQLIPGSIDFPGEVDYLRFDLVAGHTIELTLTQGTFSALATARLFAPSGADLGAFFAQSLNEFTLPESGEYTVRITANNLIGTGDYSLGLYCRDPLGPVEADLSCGDLFTKTIDARGEVDYFTFSGTNGDVIELSLTQGTFGALANGRLFAPSGADLGTFFAQSLTAFTLPETGQYAVRIIANNLIGTGDYSLGLECRSPLGPVEANLVCGDLVSSTIEARGEVDYFTFSGTNGDVIELSLTQGAFGALANGRLFAPSGADLGTFFAQSLTAFTLPETGQYAVRIIANNLIGTGDYSLGLECRSPLGPVEANLVCGDLVSSTIDARGEVDYFTFSGTNGDVIELSLTQGAFGALANGRLFAPSGADLGTFFAQSLNEFTLPETGQYAVRIIANNLVGTGDYSLGLECRSPLGPVEANLVCGDLVASTIVARGEVDYFTFSGTNGDVIELTLTQGAFGALANGRLFAPSGADLGTFFAQSLNEFTLPETGQYAVRIIASNLVGTGDYSLGLECRSPLGPVEANLNCGDLVSSTIDARGEVDYFTFDGTNGEMIEISLTQGIFSALANGRLFSPSGVDLGSFNANSLTPFTLSETGQYAIRIIANNLVGTGDYNLGLNCP